MPWRAPTDFQTYPDSRPTGTRAKKGDFSPNATFKIAVEVEPVPVAVAQSSPSLRDGFLGMSARGPSRSDGILWQIRIS